MRKQTILLLAGLLLPVSALPDELAVQVQLPDGSPVSGAVVYLNDGSQAAPIKAEISQKDRMFHPHVLVLPTGSRVDFPNQDNTQHHVYSFSPAKPFDIKLYADIPEAPVLFDQAGIVELGCNIHDHMQAFIVVTDTRAIGQTNKQGEVTLALDGKASQSPEPLSLNIWHPRLPNNTQPVVQHIDLASLANTAPVTVPLELSPEQSHDGPLDHLQNRFRKL